MLKVFAAVLTAVVFALPAAASGEIIKIWEDSVPGKKCAEAEQYTEGGGIHRYSFVSEPTLELYLVKSDKPAPLVVVCPGGGYAKLAYDLEGIEIAKWLNSIGVNAAILKYRIPDNRLGAFADAQRALRLARHNAAKWGVNPDKIGVLGFSAGGHLSARLSTGYAENIYEARDAADRLSARPDFTVLVYPAYLYADANYTIAPEIKVDKNTPPAFITQAQDDVKYIDSSIAYYLALKKAGVKADLHLFSKGGHGNGIRRKDVPMKEWQNICGEWLKYYFVQDPEPSKK